LHVPLREHLRDTGHGERSAIRDRAEHHDSRSPLADGILPAGDRRGHWRWRLAALGGAARCSGDAGTGVHRIHEVEVLRMLRDHIADERADDGDLPAGARDIVHGPSDEGTGEATMTVRIIDMRGDEDVSTAR